MTTELLEMIMLVCFGISWPVSLVRNVRAKTAKSMSLGFILLIIVGYIAGISAKIMAHNYSFVLAVYAFNLIAVSLNLVVYFVNRHYDHAAALRPAHN